MKPYVDAGTVLVNAGLGFGNLYYSYYYDEWYAGSIGIAGGAECGIYRMRVQGLPLTFGAALRAAATFDFSGYSWAISSGFDAAFMATVHLGFRGAPAKYAKLAPYDTYIGLGLGLTTGSSDYYDVLVNVGPAFLVGETYYFSEKLGVNFEYGFLGTYKYQGYSTYHDPASYAAVGLVFKL